MSLLAVIRQTWRGLRSTPERHPDGTWGLDVLDPHHQMRWYGPYPAAMDREWAERQETSR